MRGAVRQTLPLESLWRSCLLVPRTKGAGPHAMENTTPSPASTPTTGRWKRLQQNCEKRRQDEQDEKMD